MSNADIMQAVEQVDRHLDALSAKFVARRSLMELVMLGLISREHVLLIGPPGTGKSAAVQAVAKALDASSFEYLIGRFTEPGELFGALDLAALRDGEVRPVTKGMLPEAEIAFLDEIFLGSTAILNSLLKILNERTYRRGQFETKVPLISCVAASNELPTDAALAAFADRFLLTMFVDPVADHQLGDLLEAGWNEALNEHGEIPPLKREVLSGLQEAALKIDVSPVREDYAHLVRKIRLLGVPMSDRKLVKGLKLIAAAALLRGSETAGREDLWPTSYLVQSRERQAELRDLLHSELAESRNPVLTESVAHSTHGLIAHAAGLLAQAEQLLEARPTDAGDREEEQWLVRLETLLTRIDAAFSKDTLPEDLGAARTRIEETLQKSSPSTKGAQSSDDAPVSDNAE